MKDDQGNATLYIVFLAAVAFLVIAWILFSPAMNLIVGQYNNFIGEGWVSEQSGQTMNIVQYAWAWVPALGLIILFVGLIIRALIMHDGGY